MAASSSSTTLAPGALPSLTLSTFPSTTKRIALVTGANQGIGYETVKQLAENPHIIVLLGSRSAEKGAKAAAETGFKNILPIVIDVDDKKSIEAAAAEVKTKYGGLDILINNAGIVRAPESELKGVAPEQVIVKHAEYVFRTNYFGVKYTYQAFAPLLRPNARVVNVSSEVGHWTYGRLSPANGDPFWKDDAKIEDIEAGLAAYTQAATEGKRNETGWVDDDFGKGRAGAYGVSKVAVSGLTRILARENKTPGVLINAICPGYVATNLNGNSGYGTAAGGARTSVYAALLPSDGPSGTFFKSLGPYPWVDEFIVSARADVAAGRVAALPAYFTSAVAEHAAKKTAAAAASGASAAPTAAAPAH